jgi:hypothetical protein
MNPRRWRAYRVREVFCLLLAAAACILLARGMAGLGWIRWHKSAMGLGILLSLFSAGPVLLLPNRFFLRFRPAGPLLIAFWRTSVFLVPMVWLTATKSPENKIYAMYLVGCYFPFLALESWLAMRRVPPPPPP